MPIKLNGATTGSVTLTAPATGSDVTVTMPNSNVNLSNELSIKGPSPYTNAYAAGASADLTSATIVRAVREVNGVPYIFTNLTFNMPTNANTDTTDWTAPANLSTYKWSYLYIRPSDNKFYLSNTAPSIGLNTAIIGGSTVVYLFPVYVSSIYIIRFDCQGSTYLITANLARRAYQQLTDGLAMIFNTSLTIGSLQTISADLSSYIPSTATQVEISLTHSWGTRYDAGGTVNVYSSFDTYSDTNAWKNFLSIQQSDYLKTPSISSAYYTNKWLPMQRGWCSTRTRNFTTTRVQYSMESGHSDGNTNVAVNLHAFIDGNIF